MIADRRHRDSAAAVSVMGWKWYVQQLSDRKLLSDQMGLTDHTDNMGIVSIIVMMRCSGYQTVGE